MRTTIKSRKTGETFDFWAPDNGGYVRLESDGREGTLGYQICSGGGFTGSTISCTQDSFKTDCRRWYRSYTRNIIQ
jgi:hypothetical protein